MCSFDSSDLLQELWVKYLNCNYKNKSETLLAFLKSVYYRSIKDGNKFQSIFYISDASGMMRLLIREFLNDLENVCMDKDDVEKEMEELKSLRMYLESERGTLILYNINVMLDQIVSAKENEVESVRSVVIKIINDAELSNILATTLVSILSLLKKEDLMKEDAMTETIVIPPNSTLSQYFHEQLHRSSLSKKFPPHSSTKAKKVLHHRPTNEIEDSSDEGVPPSGWRPLRKMRPKSYDKSKAIMNPPLSGQKIKLFDFNPQSGTEVKELFQADIPEVDVDEGPPSGEGDFRCGNVITTMRVVTRILGNMILFDPSLCTNAISVHLETFSLCCHLLGEESSPSPLSSGGREMSYPHLSKLAEEVLCNLGVITRLLLQDRDQSAVSMLLGHKMVERLLQAHESLVSLRHLYVSLVMTLNQMMVYLFVLVARRVVLGPASHLFRGIIQLITTWFLHGGVSVARWALAEENGPSYHVEESGRIGPSLFAQFCTLLSLLNEFQVERLVLSQDPVSSVSCGTSLSHHSDKFNLVPVPGRPHSTHTCCYAVLSELLLSTVTDLLTHDSSSPMLPIPRRKLYLHMLRCIRALTFCCSMDVASQCGRLLALLPRLRCPAVKALVLRLLRILVEVSFQFHRSQDSSCQCRNTSHHDISLILREVGVACLPVPSECPRGGSFSTSTPVDLLHFFDWLARRPDEVLKSVVVDVVVRPVLLRLQSYSSSLQSSSHHYHLIGAAVLSLMPHLNGAWDQEDLDLIGSVCLSSPTLQATLYKCLTVVVLSSKNESTSKSQESDTKSRIISYLFSRVNFTSLMTSFHNESFCPETVVESLLQDTQIWLCYRLLFSYNEEFRRNMFDLGGIDCCYIILKQIIRHIGLMDVKDGAELDRSVFSIFECLMCLVVDGNMLKNSYYYEGFSSEIIWTQLQSAILSNLPSRKLVSRALFTSLFHCCFRPKWTVQDGLYQLRQLFLDSVFNVSQAVYEDEMESDTGDLDQYPTMSRKDMDMLDHEYEADVSSGVTSFDEDTFKFSKSKEPLSTSIHKTLVFMELSSSEGTCSHLEINGTLVDLVMKMVVTSKMEDHEDIYQESLVSIYNVVRTLPDTNQRLLISDTFVESMSSHIEEVLGRPHSDALKSILLKLIILPGSCWCTSARLRFLIKVSKKYENLAEVILQMLIEKATLIRTFQPEICVRVPIDMCRIASDLSSEDSSMDKEDSFDYLVHSTLTDYLWKSLNTENTAEKGGFSACMWIQMNVGILSKDKLRRNLEYRRNRRKHPKQNSVHKKSFWTLESGVNVPDDRDFVHIISLYSRDKTNLSKVFNIQILCVPSVGTLVVRLHELTENVCATSSTNVAKVKPKQGLGVKLMNIFTNSSNTNSNESDQYLATESPDCVTSFHLVDESIIHGFVSTNDWNFLTVTVTWTSIKYLTVSLFLNGDVTRHCKLHHHNSRVSRSSLNPLETMVALGHVSRTPGSLNNRQHYLLGTLLLFEDPLITCGNDNLSLMLLTPDFDGRPLTFNEKHEDDTRLLAAVVMRLLVDTQTSTESAALLLERGHGILANDWLHKISKYISTNLVGIFSGQDPSVFSFNSSYGGESVFVTVPGSNPWTGYSPGGEALSPEWFQRHIVVKNTLDSAFGHLGGISVLTFWLAYLVAKEDRISSEHLLKLFFTLLKKSIFLSCQNMQESGYSTLFQLFKSFKMNTSIGMIEEVLKHAIFDNATTLKSTTKLTTSSKLCRDPYLLKELLLQWKMWSTSKMSAKESDSASDFAESLLLDKYLLSQINCLLNEENIYSNLNCGSLGYADILNPLLLACQEPFDTLPSPLPSDICQIINQIIFNFIPTSADLNTVTKLCNAILHLYQVSMKDSDTSAGDHFQQIRSYTKPDWDIISNDCCSKLSCNSPCLSEKLCHQAVTSHVSDNTQVSTTPCTCQISDVEIRTFQKFYGDTWSQNTVQAEEHDLVKDIEKSSESETSRSSMNLNLINEDDDPILAEVFFESNYLNSGIMEEEPTGLDKSILTSSVHSSRIDTLVGLISTLENVIHVKVSDSVLLQLSMQNFCFEFLIHMLSHPSCRVRHKVLSLFRVYICQKKVLIQMTSQQPNMFAIVAHILHQNMASWEMVAETVSIIFGQNLSTLIGEIDWELCPGDGLIPHIQGPSEQIAGLDDSRDLTPFVMDSRSRLSGIVSCDQDQISSVGKFVHMIKEAGNHLGVTYRRSSVLLLATLVNIEAPSMASMLSFCSWLFLQNPVLLQASIKSGLMECVCNLCHHFSISGLEQENRSFQALLSLCVTIATDLTITAYYSQYLKLLEMCEILYFAGLKIVTKFLDKGKEGGIILELCLVQALITSSIKTICILDDKDPAFKITFPDPGLRSRIQRLSHNYSTDSTALSQKLIRTIHIATYMILNIQECFFPFVFDMFKSLGLTLVTFISKIISNCLASKMIPDHFSVYFSAKELIKNNLGDLIIFLSNPKLDLSFRLELFRGILELENAHRVTRYSLLGNSSGSMCLILNLKQMIQDLRDSKLPSPSLIPHITKLLNVISLDFDVEIIKEDNRNLWIQDSTEKLSTWKRSFSDIISAWSMNADRTHNELMINLKKCQNNYRPHARKNLQEQYITNIRTQRSCEFYRRKTWKTLIAKYTQEKAIWDGGENERQFTQLDPTEGPCRIRRRMTSSTLNLDKKFFKTGLIKDDGPPAQSLDFLFDSTYAVDRMVFESPVKFQLLKCIEDVRLSCSCSWVGQSGTFKGEFFVGKSRMGFMVDSVTGSANSSYDQVPNPLKDYGFISWKLNEISWVLKRRFKLRDLAFEVFMKDGRNCLIAANSTQERDSVIICIESFLPPTANIKPRLSEIQNKWLIGEMTNFEYLTVLNTASGRSYNDMMQYPVFPFILANYSTYILNLEEESSFRDLSNPITIQKESLRERVAQNFADKADEYQRQLNIARMSDDVENMPIWAVPPHHYSSMYSNSATVLYYMIRVPPFTHKFIEFQDHQFDRPDRMFHTLESAWELSTTSVSCVKEIIPEFFYLPEMFVNNQGFDFGVRSNGQLVDDVILPRWCQGDARLFCLIHRVALENVHVSSKLNLWLDLIFGYKQTGKHALDALNLFHPYSYFRAISPDEITEPIRRKAVEQMIENYGQIPKQLFLNRAHASKKSPKTEIHVTRHNQTLGGMEKMSSGSSEDLENVCLQKERTSVSVLPNVIGIRWGDWVGSPQNNQTFINTVSSVNYPWSSSFYLLPKSKYNKSCHKLLILPRCSNVLYLCTADDDILPVIRFSASKTSRRIQVSSMTLSHSYNLDCAEEDHGTFLVSMGSGSATVSCIAVYQRSGRIFFGMNSGLIEVFQGDVNKYSQITPFLQNFNKHWRTLCGHSSSVTNIIVGESFAVLASCDDQSTVAIWDPQRLDLMYYVDWSSVSSTISERSSVPNIDSFEKMSSWNSSTVTAMCFSETLGDLVIARTLSRKTSSSQLVSNISLFTINGHHVRSTLISGTVISLTYTNLSEGRHVNAIAAATSEGCISILSSWNLQNVWNIKIPLREDLDPVISIEYTHSGKELFVLHKSGHVKVIQSNKSKSNFRQNIHFWS